MNSRDLISYKQIKHAKRGKSLLIGSIVAPDVKVAMGLVCAVAAQAPSKRIRIDVPMAQSKFAEHLRAMSFFEIRDPSLVMSKGGVLYQAIELNILQLQTPR